MRCFFLLFAVEHGKSWFAKSCQAKTVGLYPKILITFVRRIDTGGNYKILLFS